MIHLMYLFFCHWVADFVFQSNWMAVNKSKSNVALTTHCFVYGVVMGVMLLSWKIALLSSILHFPVDYITSRITSKEFREWYNFAGLESERPTLHNFFVVVGLDQLIHICTLMWLISFLRS